MHAGASSATSAMYYIKYSKPEGVPCYYGTAVYHHGTFVHMFLDNCSDRIVFHVQIHNNTKQCSEEKYWDLLCKCVSIYCSELRLFISSVVRRRGVNYEGSLLCIEGVTPYDVTTHCYLRMGSTEIAISLRLLHQQRSPELSAGDPFIQCRLYTAGLSSVDV